MLKKEYTLCQLLWTKWWEPLKLPKGTSFSVSFAPHHRLRYRHQLGMIFGCCWPYMTLNQQRAGLPFVQIPFSEALHRLEIRLARLFSHLTHSLLKLHFFWDVTPAFQYQLEDHWDFHAMLPKKHTKSLDREMSSGNNEIFKCICRWGSLLQMKEEMVSEKLPPVNHSCQSSGK